MLVSIVIFRYCPIPNEHLIIFKKLRLNTIHAVIKRNKQYFPWLQKILRHARKLPEKSLHFYKELNRLKRAALCIGFYELLEGCAAIFDRGKKP